MRFAALIFVVAGLLNVTGIKPNTPAPLAVARTCSVADATPWISKWLDAWQLTADSILHLPNAPLPDIVFFDSNCVYTTSAVSSSAPAVAGAAFHGTPLLWRAESIHDSVTLPNSSKMPVQLSTFTNIDKKTGRPFFVMAAPSYWTSQGIPADLGLSGVFVHEFAHTRQVKGVARVLGPLDDTWKFPDPLSSNSVQTRFKSDSNYAAAYIAERDMFYRAANADSLTEVRALTRQALTMLHSRRARWFVGENAVFNQVDDLFLSLEGAAQWAAASWLSNPRGGGLTKQAAIAKMNGRRRAWSQDEGLAIFLIVDRLMPGWPSIVFSDTSPGASDLLERALRN